MYGDVQKAGEIYPKVFDYGVPIPLELINNSKKMIIQIKIPPGGSQMFLWSELALSINFDVLFFHIAEPLILEVQLVLLIFDNDFAQTFEANNILLVPQLPMHTN